jgi:hypothetical protein
LSFGGGGLGGEVFKSTFPPTPKEESDLFMLVRCIHVVFNNTLNKIYRWNMTSNRTLCSLS